LAAAERDIMAELSGPARSLAALGDLALYIDLDASDRKVIQ
jgi:hypothetical protein